MRLRGPPTLLLLALALPACAASEPSATPGPDSPETEALAECAVRAELEAYYAALSARDWVAFADHFWPGATITTIWIPAGADAEIVDVGTVERFVEQAPQGPGSREIFEEWMTACTVTLQGDLAHAWAHYEARFGDPGDVMQWGGVDAFTLMRHEGRWRIVSIAFTGTD